MLGPGPGKASHRSCSRGGSTMEPSELGLALRAHLQFESSSGKRMQGRKLIFHWCQTVATCPGNPSSPRAEGAVISLHIILLSAAFEHLLPLYVEQKMIFGNSLFTFRESEKLGSVLLPCSILSRAVAWQWALPLPSEKPSRGTALS